MKKIKISASLTVEAALCIPILLYVLVGFLYFFHLLHLHEHIQYGISNMARDISHYGYGYEKLSSTYEDEEDKLSALENLISGTYIKVSLPNYVNENLIENSFIENGIEGIHTYYSKFMNEDNRIHIIVHYKVSLPFGILSIESIPIMQRVTVSGWAGNKGSFEEKKEQEEIVEDSLVYVTEYGTVYHRTTECTYINIIIKTIPYTSLEEEAYREMNSACNICTSQLDEKPTHIYITRTGEKYHYNIGCRSLKRLVRSISVHEVGGYNPCRRCYR